MRDPVCDMEVNDKSHSFKHEGKDYFFCSDECKNEFSKSPDDYIFEG